MTPKKTDSPQRAVPAYAVPGIDPGQPMATQSMAALMIGHEAGLFEFNLGEYTLDPAADSDDRRELLAILGSKAVLPDEPGVYYLVLFTTRDGEQVPHLVPEGYAVTFVRGAAAGVSRDLAQRVNNQIGLIPAPPEKRTLGGER